MAIKEILKLYKAASRQIVNFQKFALTVSPTTPMDQEKLKSIFQMGIVACRSQYLGLHSIIGRSKTTIFEGIENRVTKKLVGWQEKLFSIGGKEVLIKTVIHAIPTYSMS